MLCITVDLQDFFCVLCHEMYLLYGSSMLGTSEVFSEPIKSLHQIFKTQYTVSCSPCGNRAETVREHVGEAEREELSIWMGFQCDNLDPLLGKHVILWANRLGHWRDLYTKPHIHYGLLHVPLKVSLTLVVLVFIFLLEFTGKTSIKDVVFSLPPLIIFLQLTGIVSFSVWIFSFQISGYCCVCHAALPLHRMLFLIIRKSC